MNEDKYTIASGHLDVGDGHRIYYQDWGNKDATPIVFLHGGPIHECSDRNKKTFDPTVHRVLFHDQRGCGLSEYKDIAKANTATTRTEDIDKLLKHLGLEKISIFGYSWGSTLALLYAIHAPKRVTRMLIGGIYTATQEETDAIFQGSLAAAYPEAWEYFIAPIPEERRDDTLGFYAESLSSGTNDKKLELMKHFMQLEATPMILDRDYSTFIQEINAIDSLDELPQIQLTVDWFKNNCYVADNYIAKNAKKLQDIPTIIVQGRQDIVCTPQSAHRLAAKMGPHSFLHIVPGSHKIEGSIREVQRAYARCFLV